MARIVDGTGFMRAAYDFVKSTVIGGVLVVLPVVVVASVAGKAFASVRAVIQPFADTLPGGPLIDAVAAALIVIVGCFVAGALARTAIGQRSFASLESRILGRIPGYELARNLSQRLLGAPDGAPFAPAFAETDAGLVPAFVVERHDDGSCTVFVPAVPTPGVGALYVMPESRVHLLDVPFSRVVKCVTSFGVGSGELLKARRL